MTKQTLTIAGLVAGIGLVACGLFASGPRYLTEDEQALLLGAQVNDRCCQDVGTCDSRNFMTPCVNQSLGSICLNCMPDETTDDLCVENDGDDCYADSMNPKDCGFKWVGNCGEVFCDEDVMFLSEECEIDARACAAGSTLCSF